MVISGTTHKELIEDVVTHQYRGVAPETFV
jgi:hypothetical protein